MLKYAEYDLEVYPNYMLCGVMKPNGKVKQFEVYGHGNSLSKKQIKGIEKLLSKYKFVGFNSQSYDDPVLTVMLNGATSEEIYEVSTTIIKESISKWQVFNLIELDDRVESIDLIDVARGQASLKLYGARLNSKKIQDLPYAFDTDLTKEQAENIRLYNINDLEVTRLLHDNLKVDLKLRASISKKYNKNVMSLNGAKVAESILINETKFKGKAPKQPEFIEYTPPSYLKFKTKELQDVFHKICKHKFLIMNNKILLQVDDIGAGEYSFLLDDLGIEKTTKTRYGKKSKKIVSDSGNVIAPDFLDKPITIDGVSHKLGLGGVHGSVTSTTITCEEDEIIVDIDYKSLYPSLKIVNKYYPKHIGEVYLDVYAGMYHTRNNVLKPKLKTLEKGSVEYNDVNEEQDIMKLVLNSSFGKEGEKFSKLYDPSSLIHTTITGQLTLMMVIEKLHLKGFKTFYANTDGITLKIKKKDLKKVQNITRKFDVKTGLEMEYNFFKSSHIRDVNNFVNITVDGDVKSKGAFGEPSLEKNSEYPIVFKAIREYLRSGKPMEITLRECKDVSQFCTSRTVKGGGVWTGETFSNTDEYDNYILEGRKQNKALEKRNEKYQQSLILESSRLQYLGKVVRWYYGTTGKPIYYKDSGNRVPKSDGAIPMMELSDSLPENLDYDFYLELCNKHLEELGL